MNRLKVCILLVVCLCVRVVTKYTHNVARAQKRHDDNCAPDDEDDDVCSTVDCKLTTDLDRDCLAFVMRYACWGLSCRVSNLLTKAAPVWRCAIISHVGSTESGNTSLNTIMST